MRITWNKRIYQGKYNVEHSSWQIIWCILFRVVVMVIQSIRIVCSVLVHTGYRTGLPFWVYTIGSVPAGLGGSSSLECKLSSQTMEKFLICLYLELCTCTRGHQVACIKSLSLRYVGPNPLQFFSLHPALVSTMFIEDPQLIPYSLHHWKKTSPFKFPCYFHARKCRNPKMAK